MTAVLQQSASAGLIGLDGELDTSWVTAKWTAPDGVGIGLHLSQSGWTHAPGQPLQVWVLRPAS